MHLQREMDWNPVEPHAPGIHQPSAFHAAHLALWEMLGLLLGNGVNQVCAAYSMWEGILHRICPGEGSNTT